MEFAKGGTKTAARGWPSTAAKIAVDSHVAREKPPGHAHSVGNLDEVEPATEAATNRAFIPNRSEKSCCHGRLDSNSAAVRQFPRFDQKDSRQLGDSCLNAEPDGDDAGDRRFGPG